MNARFPLVTASNNDQVLQTCLLRSPDIETGDVVVRRGAASIGKAYAGLMSNSGAPVVGFVHQDVYLPRGWFERVRHAITLIEQRGERWGLIGVWGIDGSCEFHGRVWDNGNVREFDSREAGLPVRVVSVDEIVLVVNTSAGIEFDRAMPGFHLYGTDLALQCAERGFGTYAIDAPIVHNTVRIEWLDAGYAEAYRYMQRKWQHMLPVPTSIMPVVSSPWPIRWARLALRKRVRRLFGPTGRSWRDADPRATAVRLGYEAGGMDF